MTAPIRFVLLASLVCGGTACSSVPPLRCGAGTIETDGTCVVVPDDAGMQGADGSSGLDGPIAQGCHSIGLTGALETPTPPGARPELLPLSGGGVAFLRESGDDFVAEVRDRLGMAVAAAVRTIPRGSSFPVSSSTSSALAGNAFALLWTQPVSALDAETNVAVLDGTAQLVSRKSTTSLVDRVYGAAPWSTGFRTLRGYMAPVVEDHDALGVSSGTHALPVTPGSVIDGSATIVPFDGGSLVVAPFVPASGTGRVLAAYHVADDGTVTGPLSIAATQWMDPLSVASSGKTAMVAVGDSSLDAIGNFRTALTMRVFLVRRSVDGLSSEEVASLQMPIQPPHLLETELLWSGSNFWLLANGPSLSARWFTESGLAEDEQVLVADRDVTSLTATATPERIIASWVLDRGNRERVFQLARFACSTGDAP